MNQSIDERAAELYDVSVPDCPGEIDLYRQLAAQTRSSGEAVLEVACGTGRVAIRLAQDGVHGHRHRPLHGDARRGAG